MLTYLKKILQSKRFCNLDKQKKILSKIGHWNFHAGNIIFPNINTNYKSFFIIDPDAKWKINDPFFSLARFIYSYPHDTIENKKYFIFSKIFKNVNYLKNDFKLKINWDKKSKLNYEKNFSEFYKIGNKNNFLNLLSNSEIFRLRICLVLCLLRGINANFENKIRFIDSKGYKFQNHSIFLLLILTKYLDSLSKNLNGKS